MIYLAYGILFLFYFMAVMPMIFDTGGMYWRVVFGTLLLHLMCLAVAAVVSLVWWALIYVFSGATP